MSRDEFSPKTKRALAARAGHVCSFPGCTQHTSGPTAEAPDKSVNLGEACHISAAASGPGARRYDHLTYLKVLSDDLGVMDHAAISLARENHIPILVFSITEAGAFARVIKGEGSYTIVTGED